MYCTKCEKEFESGTLCPICGSTLVEKAQDEDSENHIPVACDEEQCIHRIQEYFQYSGIQETFLEYDDETDTYRLLVNESDYQTAVKLLRIFHEEEKKQSIEAVEQEADEQEAEENNQLLLHHDSNSVYVNSEDKYRDNRSSGLSLLFVGAVVLIFDLLYIAGIIPLAQTGVSAWMMRIVFGVIGIAALVGGIVTLKQSSALRGDIHREDELTKEILDWFYLTYTDADLDRDIDESLAKGETLGETERQLRRLELIKSYITTEYDMPDEAFVDHLTEIVYQKLYEN